MKLFRITYTDESDPCCPEFTQRVRAHDREHAEEKFFDSDDFDGWKILRVDPLQLSRQ